MLENIRCLLETYQKKEEEEKQENKTKLGVSDVGIEYWTDYHYNNLDSEPTKGSK